VEIFIYTEYASIQVLSMCKKKIKNFQRSLNRDDSSLRWLPIKRAP
jgi:hypothetical protein